MKKIITACFLLSLSCLHAGETPQYKAERLQVDREYIADVATRLSGLLDELEEQIDSLEQTFFADDGEKRIIIDKLNWHTTIGSVKENATEALEKVSSIAKMAKKTIAENELKGGLIFDDYLPALQQLKPRKAMLKSSSQEKALESATTTMKRFGHYLYALEASVQHHTVIADKLVNVLK